MTVWTQQNTTRRRHSGFGLADLHDSSAFTENADVTADPTIDA